MDYRLPPTLLALRWAGIFAITLAVAIGAWSIYWLVLATGVRDGVLDWIGDRRADGLEIQYAGLDLAGYPGTVRVALSAPTATAADAAWSWSGESAVLAVDPLAPRALTLTATGPQSVSFRVGGRRFAYAGAARTLSVEVIGDDAVPEATLAVRDLRLDGSGQADTFAIARLDLRALGDPGFEAASGEPTLRIAATLADAAFPRHLGFPLGERIAAAALDAKLMGALEPGPWPDALDRWRDAGGTVEVTRFEVDYGPLGLSASGTLALDGNSQPIGAFTTRIQGFFQAIDALRRRRFVDDRAAITAKLVLGALARTDPGGGRPTLSIPLTLQDQSLYAGPVPLFEVPPIHW